MKIANLGRVLVAMSAYCTERAETRKQYLGPQNTELLYAIGHMLHIGAAKALEIGIEERAEEGK